MYKTIINGTAAALLIFAGAGCAGKKGAPSEDTSSLPAAPASPRIAGPEVMEAALDGKAEIITLALAQGYEVNTRDPENRTALMYAAFNGQADVARPLIAAGADVNAQDVVGTSALMFAASAPGGAETVQLLLDHGAKVNMTDNNEHFTALMWAAAEGQIENVKLLLAHNADTTLQDTDGDTAETFAEKKGHTEIVILLRNTSAEQP